MHRAQLHQAPVLPDALAIEPAAVAVGEGGPMPMMGDPERGPSRTPPQKEQLISVSGSQKSQSTDTATAFMLSRFSPPSGLRQNCVSPPGSC